MPDQSTLIGPHEGDSHEIDPALGAGHFECRAALRRSSAASRAITWSIAAEPLQSRRMGDYLSIAGDVNGTASGLVYVVDTSNELLGAMAYDDTRNAHRCHAHASTSRRSSSSRCRRSAK